MFFKMVLKMIILHVLLSLQIIHGIVKRDVNIITPNLESTLGRPINEAKENRIKPNFQPIEGSFETFDKIQRIIKRDTNEPKTESEPVRVKRFFKFIGKQFDAVLKALTAFLGRSDMNDNDIIIDYVPADMEYEYFLDEPPIAADEYYF